MATATPDRTDVAMEDHLSAPALAISGALVSAAGMLLLGIAANLGVYEGAAERMMDWHMFFSLSTAGIVTGMIEAAIIAFVFLYAFSWTYNVIALRGIRGE